MNTYSCSSQEGLGVLQRQGHTTTAKTSELDCAEAATSQENARFLFCRENVARRAKWSMWACAHLFVVFRSRAKYLRHYLDTDKRKRPSSILDASLRVAAAESPVFCMVMFAMQLRKTCGRISVTVRFIKIVREGFTCHNRGMLVKCALVGDSKIILTTFL